LAKQRLFIDRQQVIAPGDRVAHGLLSNRGIASTSGQERQPLLESVEQCRWGQHLDASGGQFDGQWQAIEAAADSGDSGRIVIRQRESRLHRRCARHKQGDGS